MACDLYSVNYHRASFGELAQNYHRGLPKPSWPRATQNFLSGGMTLIPAMKTRLAAPSDVVDLTHIAGAEGHQGVRQERHHRCGDDAL
jgi:carbon-monoxide dehydrogenase medium subunit